MRARFLFVAAHASFTYPPAATSERHQREPTEIAQKTRPHPATRPAGRQKSRLLCWLRFPFSPARRPAPKVLFSVFCKNRRFLHTRSTDAVEDALNFSRATYYRYNTSTRGRRDRHAKTYLSAMKPPSTPPHPAASRFTESIASASTKTAS